MGDRHRSARKAMKLVDPRTVFGCKDRRWFDLLQIHISREKFERWTGSEPVVEWVDGLGNADYWIIEYDCGLQLGFEFVHSCDVGHVCAREPNVNHAVRHLENWRHEISVYPEDAFKRDREWALEHFGNTMHNLGRQACCQAWRQGDDGNPLTIGYPTSKLDANCLVRQLESRGQKQIYWVENL
jgi:hypothetical protein